MWNDVTTMEGGSFYSVEVPSPGTDIDVTEQDSPGVSMWDFANTHYFPSWADGEVIPNSREEQLAFTSFKNVTKATDQ